MISFLLGLVVLLIVGGLWFIAESSEWGEILVAILVLLGVAYGIGELVRTAL